MAEIVENCPRCHAQQMTFDLLKSHFTGQINYGWQMEFEAFCICRKCKKGTIFHLKQSDIEWSNNLKNKNIADFAMNVNSIMSVKSYVSLKDQHSILPPDHVPEEVEKIFKEAATCFAVKCFNAAGTMLRLCIDLSTAPMVPSENIDGLNEKVRRDLGLRLPWLLDNKLLPESLRALSMCVKNDGNDGAHRGTLGEDEVTDLMDFTALILETVFTIPTRVKNASDRRRTRMTTEA